jgi:hypothetical protein
MAEEAPKIAVGGANKKDLGKLRWDLLPVYPMQKVVEVYSTGARKYGDYNWRKGMQWGRVYGAMMRHAWGWWGGEINDPIDGQHHLSSVAWGALTLMEYERICPEYDDRKESYKDEPLQSP